MAYKSMLAIVSQVCPNEASDHFLLVRMLGVADGRGGLQPRKIEGLSKKEVCWFAFGSGPHVLALTNKGKMYSWGHNGYSQLGLGSVNQGILPALVTAGLGESRIIQIACGSHHSLALSSDGEVGIVHTYTHTRTHTHTHTRAHTHTRTYTHTPHEHMHVHTRTDLRTFSHSPLSCPLMLEL